jgi:CcmD family protein
MDDLGYVFAAYSIIWAIVFLFVLSLYRKERRLRRDVDRLHALLDEDKHD